MAEASGTRSAGRSGCRSSERSQGREEEERRQEVLQWELGNDRAPTVFVSLHCVWVRSSMVLFLLI